MLVGLSLALRPPRESVKELRCHLFAPAVLCGLVAALSITAACRRGTPVNDPSEKPVQADGTISWTVRGPEGTNPIEGRTVTVVNAETGDRQQTATSNLGGFTFKVKPGKYSVELDLRDSEMVVKHPGVIDVHRSDVDPHADFVVAPSRVARPRYHAPRGDDGLGSGIA
jgi:hypothetical protein